MNQGPSVPNIGRCFLCEQSFPFALGHYRGHPIVAWDIAVCDDCYKGNWDGIVLEHHPRLRRHLETKGIAIRLKAKGWLLWPQ